MEGLPGNGLPGEWAGGSWGQLARARRRGRCVQAESKAWEPGKDLERMWSRAKPPKEKPEGALLAGVCRSQ